MSHVEPAKQIKEEGKRLGFEAIGIARATPGLAADHLTEWLKRGWHGEMAYMERNATARFDPSSILPGVKSVIMAALVYHAAPEKSERQHEARISRYAWGKDYHLVLKEKLGRLSEFVHAKMPEARCRRVVDSAPLMERDYARLAGIGWTGKHTLLLSRELGSWFFLGALLVDQELEYDDPFESDHCGTCTRCLDACPTEAFDGPYRLDARKCISYLTIELRSEAPLELREKIGSWVFGCDICQDVCPWNRRAPMTGATEFLPQQGNDAPGLQELLALTDETFRARFRDTAIFRAGRIGMVRNALIATVNLRRRDLLETVDRLASDSAEIVRSTAAWAAESLRKAGEMPENSPCPDVHTSNTIGPK